MTIKAYRSGETAPHWTDDCYKEKLTHGTDKILFTLSMPSKGGGVTEVQLQVTSESFETLALAMRDADENAATRAFASAGYWNLIVQAMMDFNKEATIWTIAEVLKNSEDAVVSACGTILLDYQHKLVKLISAKLRAQRQEGESPLAHPSRAPDEPLTNT